MRGIETAAWQVQYETAYEQHAVDGQCAALVGDMPEVERQHEAARLLAWSLVAELDDKPPRDSTRRDLCHCAACLLAQFRRIS